jgi:hypothetical protein
MTRPAKPRKGPRKAPPDADPDDDNSSQDPDPAPEPRKKRIKVDPSELREEAPLGPGLKISNEKYEQIIAFCCNRCNCSDEQKKKFEGDEYVAADETSLYHRRCCHNVDDHEDWLSPFHRASYKAEKLMGTKMRDETKPVSQADVWKKYYTAKRQEAELYNDDEQPGTLCVDFLLTI